MTKMSGIDREFLVERLEIGIDLFIDALSEYNTKRPSPHPQKNYVFLRDFYKRMFAGRNKRSSDIESSQYDEMSLPVIFGKNRRNYFIVNS